MFPPGTLCRGKVESRLNAGRSLLRALVFLALSTLAAVLLAGCSADGLWPFLTATATPKPAPTSSYTGPASIGNLIIKGKPETGFVAVSFDAGGKDPGLTGSVLDALKRFNGHATFFLTGEWSEANPALVKRMVAEGHELANHICHHPNPLEVAQNANMPGYIRATGL